MGVSTGGMLPPSRDCAVKLERLSAARKRAALARGPATESNSSKRSQLESDLKPGNNNSSSVKLVVKLEPIVATDVKPNLSKLKSDVDPLKPFLNIDMSAAEVVEVSKSFYPEDGNISTSTLDPDAYTENFDPPKTPDTILGPEELNPTTSSVYIKDAQEAFSPQLLNFCLQRPIVLVRNLAPACNMDLSLYTTKTLVDTHPNHAVEIRSQIEQDADENLDPSLTKPVWYCTSSRSHTTVAKYAEYQAGTLEEAWSGDTVRSVNTKVKFGDGTTRRMIKFGTNCDLSDEKKWGPQLKELMKLPAWSRVVSPGNMLSHMGHQILGMNTVQLYMKVPCSRTPGHQENNNFCAVNINIGPGDSEWFGVPNEYWGALQRLCQKNNVNYLHGSWWPTMSELKSAGIPCYRFMQRPGDMVWVNVGCVHWVQAAGWCNNIAWNVGPLTHHQYVHALERYEWNKGQRYQSIVAMVLLSWNLAKNIYPSNGKLYQAIKWTLLRSIRQTVQTLSFVRSKGCKVKLHGRRKTDPAHYCLECEEEVFNTILIKEHEKRHAVHCLRCALKVNPDLKGWMCLEEYELSELLEIYDKFTYPPKIKIEKETFTV